MGVDQKQSVGESDGSGHVLYGDRRSGNCYKVALALSQTGRRFEWRDVDVLSGETRSDQFLAMNPNGKVPLLVLPDGRCLAESNAMLLHLAEGTKLLPADPWQRALAYQWLFFEQYSHEPYIAVARFLCVFDHGQPVEEERLEFLRQRGHQALAVMETALQKGAWFAGPEFSVADIALYAYTHVAGDGGFDLGDYPATRSWLDRVSSRPGHFDMAELSP
jgi:glutathione S-transferase